MNKKNFNSKPKFDRSLSRLVAVQLVYRKNFDDISFIKAINEFKNTDNHLLYDSQRKDMDLVFFESLIDHLDNSFQDIEKLISDSLENNSIERIELVLAAIFRLATCELLNFSEIPARVIINEYVNLAYAFFDDQQPNLANGVIDNLAKKIRENEFS
mgnify:CR=1 FL=1|tara:strand:- start:202 stop:672 length:471 start_codon:yes stop_codon:yes gene_type:complete